MYLYVYMFIYAHTHIYIHIYTCTYVKIHRHAQAHTHTHTHTNVCPRRSLEQPRVPSSGFGRVNPNPVVLCSRREFLYQERQTRACSFVWLRLRNLGLKVLCVPK